MNDLLFFPDGSGSGKGTTGPRVRVFSRVEFAALRATLYVEPYLLVRDFPHAAAKRIAYE
jgi:hypothetical protein